MILNLILNSRYIYRIFTENWQIDNLGNAKCTEKFYCNIESNKMIVGF